MTVGHSLKTVAGPAMLACLITSCVNTVDPSTWNSLTPREEIRVIVQVCLPNATVSFEDIEVDLKGIPSARTLREGRTANGYREAGDIRTTVPITEPLTDPNRVTVRRWTPPSGEGQLKRSFLAFGEVLNRDGSRSASADTITLWSNSERNQPIFETEGHRPNDTIAFDVSVEVNGKFVTYWYKPPRRIPTGKFTDWQDPVSQETEADKARSRNSTLWNLMDDREMEIHAVSGSAPKIRYRLATVEEYYDQYRFWKQAQKAVGEQFYKGVVGEESRRKQWHWVPRILGSIPGC